MPWPALLSCSTAWPYENTTPLAPGQKSVSFRLTAGSPERTLSSEEVGAVRERIIDGMRGLGYELRL